MWVAYAIWSALFKQNLRAGPCRPFVFGLLFGLFELARMFVHLDYIACVIVNANHCNHVTGCNQFAF
jgi:hypothetical protein